MDEEEEGDFPDVAVGVIINAPYSVTRVDVDAEIKANIARKALKAKIEDEKTEFEHQESEMTEIRPLPKPKICSLPPQRQFFCEEGSFKSFNADSLTTESLSSSGPISCTSTNADEFFTWISSEITDSKEDVKCGFLQYLWRLVSCHPDPHVVQKCCDKLLECNTLWKLKYEEVGLVFYNWGVCRADFVTELVLESINAPVCCRTVVSPYNVENTLQVLNNQLSKGCLSGDHDSAKTVFLLLLLLSLDKDYQQCLTVIGDCVDQLATQAGSSNVHWVETYCEGLFRLQLHHAHLAFLSECVVPESMRWCLCLAHCQQVFSLDQSFQTQPKPLILHNILHEHFEQFLKLDSWELYSFLVIVDAGISQAVTLTSNEDIKKGFLDWLNHYMERRPERRKDDIDVDAALIAELVSRLQAEWESKWLEGSDPLEMEVDLTQKNETDLDVDSDTE